MRILLLNDRIPPENRGGAGEVFWRLALGLKAARHDVHVITATEQASFQAEREGIPTYHLHSRYPERWRAYLSLYNPQTAQALKTLYEQIKPDVLNAHNIHSDLSYHSLTLASHRRIPAVFTSHDVMLFAYHKLDYFIDPQVWGVTSPQDYQLPPYFNLKQMRLRYNPLRNSTIRRILTQHCQVRTAPSQALCDAHHANALPPFIPIHNGIDSSAWQVAPETIETLRAKLNLAGRKVVLFAGRLTAAKGTAQLLAALERVIPHVPNLTLLVLSSVPIEEQIQEARYTELRQKHIQAGGWLSGVELAAAYHLADIVVSPSIIFDTFPTVNLEAMAASKPVLATCYGGSREALLDGETGYIINPFATDDFADKLTRLLTDDALRLKMGQAGYRRVNEEFSLQMYVSEMLEAYQEAIHYA